MGVLMGGYRPVDEWVGKWTTKTVGFVLLKILFII